MSKPIVVSLLKGDPYKVGGPAPEGYGACHEWTAVQHRGGLWQYRCGTCGKWRFPQERCCEEEVKG